MEKVKFSNDKIFEIPVAGIHSTDEALRISFLSPESNLVELEEMFSDSANLAKIMLLSESDEVLRIYSGYTKLTSIEKKKGVVVNTEIEETTDETTGEVIDTTSTPITSDVVYITLKKEDDTETRLAALEETVDVLVLDSLGM